MDYFLNKVYADILKGKNQKKQSAYRTLSESYDVVYEQDANEQQPGILIDPDKFVTAGWSPAQKSLYDLTANNVKATDAEEEVPDELNPEVTPQEAGAKSKSLKTTGVGPGEYAVVSVVTGVTDPAKCAEYLSGSNKDYDITWPSGSKDPKYIFEIKDIQKGAARIAKHGAEFTRTTISDVSDILNAITDEYDLLNEEDKAHVNQYVISQGVDLKEPETRTYTRSGKGFTTTSITIKTYFCKGCVIFCFF
jgi:hypothetical protein